MRDVADAIEMHESTVSRVVANKTLACPHGVVPMKAFFGAALASSQGADGVTAVSVKVRIGALIAAEDALRPLSDDALTRMLKAEGTEIARRTVAKYREALGLPSSSRRKRARALDA